MSELSFSTPLLVKQGEAGILEGFASTFGTGPDLSNDVVSRGAFLESLKQHKAQGTRHKAQEQGYFGLLSSLRLWQSEIT